MLYSLTNSKKHTNWLAYYVTPVIQEKPLTVEKSSEIIDDFSHQLNKDYHQACFIND